MTGCSSVNFTYHESQEEVWTKIQKAYDLSRGGKPRHAQSYTGVTIPFDVQYDEKAVLNNAIVTTEIVPEGTKVWEDWHYGRFSAKSKKRYGRFLEPLELKLQCLVLSMTHASYDGSYLEVTMDEGNYIQDAQFEEQINVDVDCIATRDIHVGERLYMNFTEYIGYDHEIEWFEDLKYEAFRDTKLRGAKSPNPSSAVAWSERPKSLDSTSSNAKTRTPAHNEYPSMVWPTLIILATVYAVKKATASSRLHQEDFNKSKFC